MEQITISKDEYTKLVKHQLFADAVKSILATRAKEKLSIFSDEVKLICKLFGIEVDSE